MDEDDAKEPAVASREAYQELIEDSIPVPSSTDVSTGHDILGPEMHLMRRVIQMTVQECLRAAERSVKDVKEREEIL
jgi:hypothetical protein